MTLAVVIIIFFGLLLFGCPIVICMGASSAVWLLLQPMIPDLVIAQKMFTACDNFALMAVPFFMMAGELMDRTGIIEDIVDFAESLVGHIRGGLAHTVLLAGMMLAGISGSSNADAASLGMMIKTLKKGGYEEGESCAIVGAAASLGPVIPPSIIMILFGNAVGMNIGALFIGGLAPGVCLVTGYMIVSYFIAKRRGIALTRFEGWKNVGRHFKKAFWALVMPVIIIGGMRAGVFTATEGGVTAVVYGIAYGLIGRRLDVYGTIDALRKSAIASAGPISIIAISSIFSYILAREGVTAAFSNFCGAHIHSQFGLLILIALITVIGGCFIDGVAVMLLLTPIVYPMVEAMGINEMQFALIFLLAIMSGGLTPPVGSILYIVAAFDNTPLSKIARAVVPFVSVIIAVMIIMMVFPAVATLVPALFGYTF
jgi:C4-dicarboxylate transporter DctM subunit